MPPDTMWEGNTQKYEYQETGNYVHIPDAHSPLMQNTLTLSQSSLKLIPLEQ